jgi:hypothetical protein
VTPAGKLRLSRPSTFVVGQGISSYVAAGAVTEPVAELCFAGEALLPALLEAVLLDAVLVEVGLLFEPELPDPVDVQAASMTTKNTIRNDVLILRLPMMVRP